MSYFTLALTVLVACTGRDKAADTDTDTDERVDVQVVITDGADDSSRDSAPPADQEVCDGVDNDLDGEIDEDPADGVTCYPDEDGDGQGASGDRTSRCACEADESELRGDCDDHDPTVYEGAPPSCDDGEDHDCNGEVDAEEITDSSYEDRDDDGARALWNVNICGGESQEALSSSSDCDDTDAAVYPGATEQCDDVDEDCDGDTDDASPYEDLDSDGYGYSTWSGDCVRGRSYSKVNTDCDDSDSAVHPRADELCDEIDNNCDGAADEGLTFVDADGDGVGGAWPDLPCDPALTYVWTGGDCDDDNPAVYFRATERCDGLDNDCDGVIDNDYAWVDADGDGYGAEKRSGDCASGADYAAYGGDCDDTSASVSPVDAEVCDGQDNDCDGEIDEGFEYVDADGDGYGATARSGPCEAGTSYVADDGDCDDSVEVLSPGICDTCDGVDNDCDGSTDNFDGSCHDLWIDLDLDGYGKRTSGTCSCLTDGYGVYASRGGDCDDEDGDRHPGQGEICGDGEDNDCDGLADCEDDDCPDEACMESDCDDDLDDDEDGATDCEDDDCWSAACSTTVAKIEAGALHRKRRVLDTGGSGATVSSTTMNITGSATGTVRLLSAGGMTVEACSWRATGIDLRGRGRWEEGGYSRVRRAFVSSTDVLTDSGCTYAVGDDSTVTSYYFDRDDSNDTFMVSEPHTVTLNPGCTLTETDFLPDRLQQDLDTLGGDRWYYGDRWLRTLSTTSLSSAYVFESNMSLVEGESWTEGVEP